MYHDGKQYDKSRFLGLAWVQRLQGLLPSLIQELSQQFGVELEHEFLTLGSFNCCYRLKGLHSVIRFPILCKSAFRYEKTTDECLVMTYISRHTSIPVPKLLASKSCDLEPYVVLSLLDGSRLSDSLKAPSSPEAALTLQPDIDTALLSRVYQNMTTVILELSKCQFGSIGAVGQDSSGNWEVAKRPITLNMNQLVSCGNFPPKLFPQRHQTFATANEYFTALAEMHITHLQTQRNDAVDDADDCRRKYVARHLFLKIARTFSTEFNHGPFPLYCDDFCPTNVLFNSDLDISGVIDWEIFPDAIREEEAGMIQRGTLSEGQRLSTHMSESLENGQFWFCLAVTSSFGFDDIFWKFIDPLYFGEFTTLTDRIGLLTIQEQGGLDAFLELKMQQAEDSDLDEHTDSHEMFTA